MSKKTTAKKALPLVGCVGFFGSVIAIITFLTGVTNIFDIGELLSSKEPNYKVTFEEKVSETIVSDSEYQPVVNTSGGVYPFSEVDARVLIDEFRENPDAIYNDVVGQRIGIRHSFSPDNIKYERYSEGCKNIYSIGFAGFWDFQKVLCLWVTDKKFGDAPVNTHCIFRTQNGGQQQALNAKLFSAIKNEELSSISGNLVYIKTTPLLGSVSETRKLKGIHMNQGHFEGYRALLVLSDCQAIVSDE